MINPPKFFASMRGQLLLLLLGALLIVQCLGIWLFLDERQNAILASSAKDGASRLLNVASELEKRQAPLHDLIMRAAESRDFRLTIDGRSIAAADGSRQLDVLTDELSTILPVPAGRSLQIALHVPDQPLPPRPDLGDQYGSDPLEMVASVALLDGRWLNARMDIGEAPFRWAWQAAVSTVLMVTAVVTVVWFLVNRITGPLRMLALASQRLGRGQGLQRMPTAGPSEVIQLTSAFEDMAERITRLLTERSATLAAIGHDLRSPITAMRLRVEMVDDDETRERLETCLDEIQSLVQAALALAKGADTGEATVDIRLDLLLSQITHDLRETGGAIRLQAPSETAIRGRPDALKRALRNVAENAIRYGLEADISLETSKDTVRVFIDDKGPGIPEEERQRVFEPLVRLETSRSRHTGGSGLGLALAKSIIESHGGRIRLLDAPSGGVRAEIYLPMNTGE